MTAYYASISEEEQNYRENAADSQNDEEWLRQWLDEPEPAGVVYEVEFPTNLIP